MLSTSLKKFQKSKESSPVHQIIAEAVDIASSSSQSSVKGITSRNYAFEKVNSWLDRGREGKNELGHGERCTTNSKYSPSCLNYPPIADKVQALLFYGEYSLFRKWVVLIEGDFVQIRFNETGKTELVHSTHSSSEATVINVTKKKKCSLQDIRTVALTRNWLVICHMQRTYQVDKDGLMPAGIFLQLRRLVPLKFLKVRVSRSTQKVIAIENQSGLIKEYQLIERPDTDGNEQITAWKKVIKSLEPNHDDDTLLTTLRMYERWSQQHSCRITVCPSKQKLSDTSLPDWLEKRPKRNAPLPPQKSQDSKKNFSREAKEARCFRIQKDNNKFSEEKHQTKILVEQSEPKEILCNPANKVQSTTRPVVLQPQASSRVNPEGRRGRSSTRSTDHNKASSPYLWKDKKSPSRNKRNQAFSKYCDQSNDFRINNRKPRGKESETLLQICPRPYYTTKVTSESGSTVSFLTGCDASIGESYSMTLSQSSEPVVGIEAPFGPSRPMSPDGEFEIFQQPAAPTEEKRPKRSVKDVFKMGLFLSKKNKKKISLASSAGSTEPHPPPEPPKAREIKRRTSRLEMGIPIEEVFSGIEFATIDKTSASSSKSEEEPGPKRSVEGSSKSEGCLPDDNPTSSNDISHPQDHCLNNWNLDDIPEDLT